MTRGRTVREIVDCILINYDVKVNTEAARLIRGTIIKDQLENQREQFQKIPTYLKYLDSKNPELQT